jgi:hypothetical protein
MVNIVKQTGTNFYGKAKNSFSDEEKTILQELGDDKNAREYYEELWREFIYAYQTMLYEYSIQRQYNPNLPPEQQVRKMFPQDNRLNDYKLPLEFAVITRQLADELASLPTAKWSSLTSDLASREAKSKTFQRMFDWILDINDSQWETVKTLLSKGIFGTAFEYVYHEYVEYPDHEVSGVKEGMVQWKKINRIISRTRFKNLDIRRVVMDHNANDIEDAEHSFIFQNLGESTFKQLYGNKKFYNIENIKAMPLSDVYVSLGEARKGYLPDVVQVGHYFNVPKNQHVILANGQKISIEDQHIPIPSLNGKRPMMPLAVYYESKAQGEFYGISKSQVIKPFREVKNKLRNAFFDIAKKVAFNTLVVDPMSDFDETTYEFGQPFIRAVPDEVKPLPVSANLQPVIELDKQTDQDVIMFTGINIQDISGGPASESATKSAIRKESQTKLVELGLKMNSYHGFKRRNILLKQLIRLHYKSARIKKVVGGPTEPLQITTKGTQLRRGVLNKGKIYEEKIDGMGIFEMRAGDFRDDVDLIMEGGNVSITKELIKARQQEAAEYILKIPPDPQKQMPFDVQELVNWAVEWGELPKEISANPEKPLEEKSEDEIMEEAGVNLLDKPQSMSDIINQKQDVERQETMPTGEGPPVGATPLGGPALLGGTPPPAQGPPPAPGPGAAPPAGA